MRLAANKILRRMGWIGLLALPLLSAASEYGVYQTRDEFLKETFGHEQPKSDVIWIDDELRRRATDILGHPPTTLRIRYWYDSARTAWVIDEIGKEKPITLGVVIENDEIRKMSVLQFRESRGWEIRYPFFTEQFTRIRLDEKGSLSERIDGITGATLSVRATTRTANLALILDEYTRRPTQTAAAAP